MAKGILLVETYPVTPEQEADYHEWYDGPHLEEVLGIDGFVSARRFAPVVADGGPFVAIYEIEADDVAAVMQRLVEKAESGTMSSRALLATDPAPETRLLEEITARP
jgi:hypothetical protein